MEAKGRKASTTGREVPGETLPNSTEPACAIEGSRKYLDLTLETMLDSEDPAREAIATDLRRALANEKVVYLQVRTIPRPNGMAYYSVKRYKIYPGS